MFPVILRELWPATNTVPMSMLHPANQRTTDAACVCMNTETMSSRSQADSPFCIARLAAGAGGSCAGGRARSREDRYHQRLLQARLLQAHKLPQQPRFDCMTVSCPGLLGSNAATCSLPRCICRCSVSDAGQIAAGQPAGSDSAPQYLSTIYIVYQEHGVTLFVCFLCARPPDEADAQALRAAVLLDELPPPASAAPGAIVVEAKASNALRLVASTCSRRVLAVPTTALAAFR